MADGRFAPRPPPPRVHQLETQVRRAAVLDGLDTEPFRKRSVLGVVAPVTAADEARRARRSSRRRSSAALSVKSRRSDYDHGDPANIGVLEIIVSGLEGVADLLGGPGTRYSCRVHLGKLVSETEISARLDGWISILQFEDFSSASGPGDGSVRGRLEELPSFTFEVLRWRPGVEPSKTLSQRRHRDVLGAGHLAISDVILDLESAAGSAVTLAVPLTPCGGRLAVQVRRVARQFPAAVLAVSLDQLELTAGVLQQRSVDAGDASGAAGAAGAGGGEFSMRVSLSSQQSVSTPWSAADSETGVCAWGLAWQFNLGGSQRYLEITLLRRHLWGGSSSDEVGSCYVDLLSSRLAEGKVVGGSLPIYASSAASPGAGEGDGDPLAPLAFVTVHLQLFPETENDATTRAGLMSPMPEWSGSRSASPTQESARKVKILLRFDSFAGPSLQFQTGEFGTGPGPGALDLICDRHSELLRASQRASRRLLRARRWLELLRLDCAATGPAADEHASFVRSSQQRFVELSLSLETAAQQVQAAAPFGPHLGDDGLAAKIGDMLAAADELRRQCAEAVLMTSERQLEKIRAYALSAERRYRACLLDLDALLAEITHLKQLVRTWNAAASRSTRLVRRVRMKQLMNVYDEVRGLRVRMKTIASRSSLDFERAVGEFERIRAAASAEAEGAATEDGDRGSSAPQTAAVAELDLLVQLARRKAALNLAGLKRCRFLIKATVKKREEERRRRAEKYERKLQARNLNRTLDIVVQKIEAAAEARPAGSEMRQLRRQFNDVLATVEWAHNAMNLARDGGHRSTAYSRGSRSEGSQQNSVPAPYERFVQEGSLESALRPPGAVAGAAGAAPAAAAPAPSALAVAKLGRPPAKNPLLLGGSEKASGGAAAGGGAAAAPAGTFATDAERRGAFRDRKKDRMPTESAPHAATSVTGGLAAALADAAQEAQPAASSASEGYAHNEFRVALKGDTGSGLGVKELAARRRRAAAAGSEDAFSADSSDLLDGRSPLKRSMLCFYTLLSEYAVTSRGGGELHDVLVKSVTLRTLPRLRRERRRLRAELAVDPPSQPDPAAQPRQQDARQSLNRNLLGFVSGLGKKLRRALRKADKSLPRTVSRTDSSLVKPPAGPSSTQGGSKLFSMLLKSCPTGPGPVAGGPGPLQGAGTPVDRVPGPFSRLAGSAEFVPRMVAGPAGVETLPRLFDGPEADLFESLARKFALSPTKSPRRRSIGVVTPAVLNLPSGRDRAGTGADRSKLFVFSVNRSNLSGCATVKEGFTRRPTVFSLSSAPNLHLFMDGDGSEGGVGGVEGGSASSVESGAKGAPRSQTAAIGEALKQPKLESAVPPKLGVPIVANVHISRLLNVRREPVDAGGPANLRAIDARGPAAGAKSHSRSLLSHPLRKLNLFATCCAKDPLEAANEEVIAARRFLLGWESENEAVVA